MKYLLLQKVLGGEGVGVRVLLLEECKVLLRGIGVNTLDSAAN